MPRAIKEFRDNGQLHRIAIVDGKKIISIRVFDADGSEFKWVNPKPWRIGSSGELVSPKQMVKDDYEAENGVPDTEETDSRRSIADTAESVVTQRLALEDERNRLQEMVSILLERTEYIQDIAETALSFGGSNEEAFGALERIQQAARDSTRRVFDEDR